MGILLSSASESVVSRWAGLLDGHYRTGRATSVTELKQRCMTGNYNTVLLHRTLVDTAAFSSLRSLLPEAKFFLFSDRPDEEEAISFLKLGIVGYANTYISSERLLEALRTVENGGVWLGQKVIQYLIREMFENSGNKGEEAGPVAALAKLTRAERLIAEAVARGASNLEIAADLKITERTVKAHLTSIYEKTKTGNRLNLALLINRGKVSA